MKFNFLPMPNPRRMKEKLLHQKLLLNLLIINWDNLGAAESCPVVLSSFLTFFVAETQFRVKVACWFPVTEVRASQIFIFFPSCLPSQLTNEPQLYTRLLISSFLFSNFNNGNVRTFDDVVTSQRNE